MNRRSVRVLLIDSSLLSIRLLKQGLEEYGYEVVAASNKDLGAEIFRQNPVHVIVAEVSESSICGIHVAEALAVMGVEVPLIALATGDHKGLRDLADRMGAVQFIPKPTSVDEVRGFIEEALAVTPAPKPVRVPHAAPPRAPVAAVHPVAPTAQPMPDPRHPAPAPSGPGAGGSGAPRVLLVDDDPIVRKFLRVVLEQLGIEILEAKGAFDAWKIVHKQKIDVVVTDLVMEGYSGFDLLRNMRVQKVSVPAVVLTGHATPENIARARKYGALAILEKSADITPVRDTVLQVLGNLGYDTGAGGSSAFAGV